MESNISVMIILWCILYNLMIPSLSKETSILLDPKSEFIDYVKPINEKVMVYTDEQLKDFKEKHKQDKLIDMTKNLVLNDENIYDKFPTGEIKMISKPVHLHFFAEEPNIHVLNLDKLQTFKNEHQDDHFIYLENPLQHDFSQSKSALSLVKTSKLKSKKDILKDISIDLKELKSSIKDLHHIHAKQELMERIQEIRYTQKCKFYSL